MYNMENTYWWYAGLHELVYAFTKKYTRPGSIIFDAGCGTGRMVEILQKEYLVEGCDFSEAAIGYCRKRGLTSVHRSDLNDFNLPLTYDQIISLDVIYHEAIQNDDAVLDAFHGALKPNGILVLNLPAFPILRRKHNVFVHEKRRYTRPALLQYLRKKGWTIHTATYRMPWLFCISLVKKWIESFACDGPASDLKPLPEWLNSLLLKLVTIENKLIAGGVSLPFGSSLFIVARKK